MTTMKRTIAPRSPECAACFREQAKQYFIGTSNRDSTPCRPRGYPSPIPDGCASPAAISSLYRRTDLHPLPLAQACSYDFLV